MTPELQEIANANPHDEVVPALLMRKNSQWFLIIAERQSDGTLRHVDVSLDAYVPPMLNCLRGARPEEQAMFERDMARIRGEGPSTH